MTILAADAHLQPNITLIVVASVLVGAGVYLLLERSLTRVLLGIVLMSNGVSTLYLVVSGKARGAALLGERPPEQMSDPLPQAFVLTAIVISLATVAFVMAMAYRYWRLTGSDDVPDDLEDALILRLAERDQPSESYDADVTSTTEAEEDPDEVDAREAEERARAHAAAHRAAIEADVTTVHPEVEPPDAREPGAGPTDDVFGREVVADEADRDPKDEAPADDDPPDDPPDGGTDDAPQAPADDDGSQNKGDGA